MKKFKEAAQDYFERHTVSDECHITSDGRVFHTKGSAQGFAGTLDDQEIESYNRKVLEKEQKIDTDSEGGDASDADILKNTILLKEADLEKLDYNELKSLAKFFEVEAENQKAPTLIEALTKFKETLNS